MKEFDEDVEKNPGFMLFTYIVGLILILVLSIIGLFNENKYLWEYVLISLFVVPITIWSFSKTLVDINCIPTFIKIKNEMSSKTNDEKVDAYFDYLESQKFSIFAPFVLIGIFIASGFLYTHSVSNFYAQDFTLNKVAEVFFHCWTITYGMFILIMLIINVFINKSKKVFNIIIRILLLCGYITSIIFSFSSPHLLMLLFVSVILSDYYRAIFKALKNMKKEKKSS